MELQFSELEVLSNLGLTVLQARVYLVLVKSGPLNAFAISKSSKVARPDVYRILAALRQLGLAERVIQEPLEHRAIPLNEALPLLLRTKRAQYEKVRAETRLFLASAQLEAPNSTIQPEGNQLFLIPEGKTIVRKINTAIKKSQLSIDVVASWKRFSRGIVSTFAESIETAWAKGVKIRFILEGPLNSKTAEQLVQFCRGKPFCQIRFIRCHPKTVFGIFDKREVEIVLNSQSDLPGSAALWCTNPSVVALAEDYFEMLWLKAIRNWI